MKNVLNYFLISIFVFIGLQVQAQELKAVLIVGNVEENTPIFIKEMNKISILLEQHQVKTYKFYNHKADWNNIVDIAKDCNFFIYTGHGSTAGKNNNAGGICLKNTVSTEKMLSTLKLKDNALVLFMHVCYGAGSTATDLKDIGIQEAEKRVRHYAFPFFEVGAAAYYANNFDNGVYSFLELFLTGKSIYEAYKTSVRKPSIFALDKDAPSKQGKSVCIASTLNHGYATYTTTDAEGNKKEYKIKAFKDYNIALVGNKDFNINIMKGN